MTGATAPVRNTGAYRPSSTLQAEGVKVKRWGMAVVLLEGHACEKAPPENVKGNDKETFGGC